ncbi:FliA/WhiG family RNA polymerase sigma factor [Virgibacillus sp. YIM 98842]|jgi:RNA polymerase sigma factor for flagellar operon FliA|uniref:FliA/WhiG family RNA polymerase sigma factor n=1 Tax=Virgibacillus sp. YIM 98842 TaxID=2663533 RepID=UPI0013DC0FEC|nr:FliA/WhiG family RNA polymerase sigma factor [Virgibacillus sp. YIM 98842]
MQTNTTSREAVLWKNWLEDRDEQAANKLIQQYMHLVSFHVERISSHLPTSVNKDDVQSFGLIGLFDAIKKFEPSRELKFDTYASFRIRGAIMDGLRKEDWIPRSLRDKIKKVEKITQELEQLYQRKPKIEEISKSAGLEIKETEVIIRDSLFSNILSMEEKPAEGKSELKEGIGYSVPDKSAVLPEEQLVSEELKKDLAEGIKALNENEKLVISLFYHDELTLTEIGKVLGLTTSRISQIHKRSIVKLRDSLRKIQAYQ